MAFTTSSTTAIYDVYRDEAEYRKLQWMYEQAARQEKEKPAQPEQPKANKKLLLLEKV